MPAKLSWSGDERVGELLFVTQYPPACMSLAHAHLLGLTDLEPRKHSAGLRASERPEQSLNLQLMNGARPAEPLTGACSSCTPPSFLPLRSFPPCQPLPLTVFPGRPALAMRETASGLHVFQGAILGGKADQIRLCGIRSDRSVCKRLKGLSGSEALAPSCLQAGHGSG